MAAPPVTVGTRRQPRSRPQSLQLLHAACVTALAVATACTTQAVARPVTAAHGDMAAASLQPSCSDAPPGSRTSCRAAFESAVAACAATAASDAPASCTIKLSPGVYVWDSTPLATSLPRVAGMGQPVLVANLTAVTISGYGATVVTRAAGPLAGWLQFEYIDGLAIEGVTLDAERAPHTFVRIDSVDAVHGGANVTFNATRYPVTLVSHNGTKVTPPWLGDAPHVYGALDPATRLPQLPMYWGGGGSMAWDAPVGAVEGHAHLASAKLPASMVGQWVVLEHSREHTAIEVRHCSDVVVRDVTLLSNPGFGYLFYRTRNVAMQRARIVARPDRAMSVMADGAHFTLCSGTVQITDSVFDRNGDDCFAIHNGYQEITAFLDASRTLVSVSGREPLDVVVGEPWLLRSRRTLQPLGAVVSPVSVDFAAGHIRFNASLPPDAAVFDVLTPLTRPTAVVLHNSSFTGNLGHGIRIKTDNVLVSNCTLGRNSFMPLLMVPDAAVWMSSLVVHNATVTGCVFDRGGVWANAQYDVDATSVTVTAYVPESFGEGAMPDVAHVAADDAAPGAGASRLPARLQGGGAPSGAVPLSSGTVNRDIAFVRNTVWQADGVATALLMRATSNYTVADNVVHWGAGVNASRDGVLVHELNSDGTIRGNTCFDVSGRQFSCGSTAG